MKLTVVILVLLPIFLHVVYSDESTGEISSVLELFPDFKQMSDNINKMNDNINKMNDKVNKLLKGWALPFKTHLKNYRMKSDIMESRVFPSELECWIACTETSGCTSVSFQSEGGTCKLSSGKHVSYEVLEKTVGWDVFTKHRPVVSLHDHQYSLDFAAAKKYCASIGLSIATFEDLNAAYYNGYQKCNCGWAANGNAYLVMQEAADGCLSAVGVLQCNWKTTWNVYCKPLKSD